MLAGPHQLTRVQESGPAPPQGAAVPLATVEVLEGRRGREISADVQTGTGWGRSGGDSPVRVSAPPTNVETLQETNADVSNRKWLLQDFLMVPPLL